MKVALLLLLAVLFAPFWLAGFLAELSWRMLQTGWDAGKAFRKWMTRNKS